jgi:hypothetical protein
MGLSLLAPLFLAGLVGLAIPVLIHLTHRERKDVVPFPSLMFLERIPYPSTRRSRIRDLLLFALRCLAVVLIVAAFTRPLIDRKSANTGGSLIGAREVVVLLDRSYSMGYGDRWTRAQDAARKAVDNIGATDKATIVLFDSKAVAANQGTSDRASLRAAIGSAELGSGVTKFVPALKLAEKILVESELPRREIVLISDYQKVGWEGHEEIHVPSGTKLTTVPITDKEPSNIAVSSATLHREVVDGREQLRASARITYTGQAAQSDVPVMLELNGRVLETKQVTIEPNASRSVTFSGQAIPTGLSRGTIRAGKDGLKADNAFNFVLSPDHVVSILILEPASARPTESFYLTSALGQGTQPEFRTQVKHATQFEATDLVGRSVVVLNDTPFPSGEPGKRLREYVQQGGGLVVVLGENLSQPKWPADAADMLPGTIGEPVDRRANLGGTLAALQLGHPILEVFRAPRSGDFTSARFEQYRPLKGVKDSSVIMRFDDGSPALTERKVGNGRVLTWGSTLDLFWNNFATQPVFLPFVHQVAKYAATYADIKSWSTVGQVLDLAGQDQLMNRGSTASASPSGKNIAITVEAPSGRTIRVAGTDTSRYLELEQQGFYSLKQTGSRGDRTSAVAVNLDLAESDLSSLDPSEFAISVAPKAGLSAEGGAFSSLTAEEKERRQTLWVYILMSAVLLLGAETLLSNRLMRAGR